MKAPKEANSGSHFHLKRRSHAFTAISLVIGLILFVYLVGQVGLDEICARVRALGSGFILIIVLSAIRPAVRSWAWLRAMTPEERGVGFFAVWYARLVGDAMGNLTLVGPFIAEPFRLKALNGKLPLAAGISSLTAETLTYAISSCVVVMAGMLLLLTTFVTSESLQAVSLAALGSMLLVICVTILVVAKRWFLLSGLGIKIVKLLRLDARLGHKIEYLVALEKYIFDFYARRPADFFIVALCELSFHLAGVAETYATLHLIEYSPTLQTAFIFEAIGRAINLVFNFVPARLGVDEAGSGLLAQTLGFGTGAGVTLAIVRKARVFFWSALGLLFLAGEDLKQQFGE